MKIVLVCNEYPAVRPHAGIGTVVQILAIGLWRRGHEVTVVGWGERNQETWDQGVRVVTLQGSRRRYIGNLQSRLNLRRWLIRRAAEGQIDLVEVPDSQGVLPFGATGCKVVVRLHLSFSAVGEATGEKHGRGLTLYERLTVRRNRRWIAVSRYVLELTRKTFNVAEECAQVIYNPSVPIQSDLPEIAGLPEKFVLFAGHVGSRKGADVLASAMRVLMDERPDLHLVYVGGIYEKEGRPISEHIRAQMGSQLSERVHFLGCLERNQVLTCMKSAAVFAFPSWVEGFPMVILEAMKCGTPVVYSRHPAGTEVIQDGISGLLADPACPLEFSDKICRILNDPALARHLAENGKMRVTEQFSVDAFLDATEKFYQECIAND